MKYVLILFLGGVLLCGTASGADTAHPPSGDAANDEERFRLAAELERTLGQLRTVREERYREQARHDAEERSLRERASELEARTSAQEARVEELGARAEEEIAQGAAVEAETTAVRASLEGAARALEEGALNVRAWILDSLPFRKEARLAALTPILERADDDPLRDRVRRFQGVLEYEMVLGSTSEAYRDRVTLAADRVPRARCMRLGMVLLAFLSEEGDETGVLARPADGQRVWVTDLGFLERWGLKRGLEILERRRPPVFVRFPVDFGRIRRAESPAAARVPEEGGR